MSESNETRARGHADELRRSESLGSGPINDLVELIERCAGCDVAIVPMPDDMDGMVVHDPETRHAVIGVATSDNPVRQRMTLAHELGHLVTQGLAREFECGSRTDDEVVADAFARHLLVPCEGVNVLLEARGTARSSATLDDLSAVMRHFQVSPAVATIQMRDAGWIDRSRAEEWMSSCTTLQIATRFGWRPEYDSWAAEAAVPRPPRRLLRRAIEAYVDGAVSIGAVAQVAGRSADAMQTELRAQGLVPREIDIRWLDLDIDP